MAGTWPSKFIAVHVSYRSRAMERGALPPWPSYFLKPPSTVAADGDLVRRPPWCELLAFEGEVALIIGEADKIDQEFGLYLRMLLYTGIRKSEGLDLLSANVRPDDQAAWVQTSKNEDPRMLKLREDLVAPFTENLFALDRGDLETAVVRGALGPNP